MEVILLERIAKLGQMGDTVNVKTGFARNYLLPQGKALRATETNLAKFESQRADLEVRNLERKTEAEQVKSKIDGTSHIIIRSAGQTGQLYGSVSPRDIVAVLDEAGFKIDRNQVNLPGPIKLIGLHTITLALHPEVESEITVNVARSDDEAELQAAGKDLTGRADLREEKAAAEEEAPNLEELFENPDEVELTENSADEEAGLEAVVAEASEKAAESVDEMAEETEEK